MVLYTGKGDAGTSKFFEGKERHCKNDRRFWVLGGIDELNSWIGVCRSQADLTDLKKVGDILLDVQQKLFIIQAEIAASVETLAVKQLPTGATQELEKIIDSLEVEIGQITKFSIPGGHILSAMLDYGRTVCRRAERELVGYSETKPLNPAILSYVNRLSSLLFALARWVNKKEGIKEKHPGY